MWLSGIGHAITAALYRTGASKIYILGRRLPSLQNTAKSLETSGSVITPIVCDVTSKQSVLAARDQIARDTGYVDVLVNNAGVLGPDHKPAKAAETVEELQKTLLDNWNGGADGIDAWDTTFRANCAAVSGVSAAYLALLDKGNQRRGWQAGRIANDTTRKRNASEGVDAGDQRTSQIITTASIAAFNRVITAGLAYSSSKAAAAHLGKMLATLLAPWGIRSNVIAPGIYPSEMTEGSKAEYTPQEIPAGHKGEYDDIAGVVLYLVGRAGSYVNGNVQITDGGRLSVHPATY